MRTISIMNIRMQRAIVYESAIEKIIQAFLKHQPEAQNDALLEAFECLGNMQALNETERFDFAAQPPASVHLSDKIVCMQQYSSLP